MNTHSLTPLLTLALTLACLFCGSAEAAKPSSAPPRTFIDLSFVGLYEGLFWNGADYAQVYGADGTRELFACTPMLREQLKGKVGLQITVQYHLASVKTKGGTSVGRKVADTVTVQGGAVDQELNATRERAYRGGDPEAANTVGVWYSKGLHGLPTDPEMAIFWYKQAVAPPKGKQPSALAMHNLGDCYRDGVGVEQNGQTAFDWYRKASLAGHAIGLEDMGDCYRDGIGVTKDLDMASAFYSRAASQGRKSAVDKLRELGSTSAANSLDSWLGDYSWTEDTGTPVVRTYALNIGELEGYYMAHLQITDAQGEQMLLARLRGTDKLLILTFEKNLQGSGYKGRPGDELLRLELREDQLFTRWGGIHPATDRYMYSSGRYFMRVYAKPEPESSESSESEQP